MGSTEVKKEKCVIGVFDSGIGGLTAMRDLVRILPQEKIIYFGDTARAPYGSHSKEVIQKFSLQDQRFLLSKNIRAELIACGTVTSTSYDILSANTDIPVFGIIDAAARKIAGMPKNKKVLVLATEATVKTGAYFKSIKALSPDIEIIEKACPRFVPLIENGYGTPENSIMNQVVADTLQPYLEFDPDIVVLGCTHYPVIRENIANVFPSAEIVEPGKEAAIDMADYLAANNMLTEGDPGELEIYVSQYTEAFEAVCRNFFGSETKYTICQIDIEKY